MATDIAAGNAHEIEEIEDRLDATLTKLARMEQGDRRGHTARAPAARHPRLGLRLPRDRFRSALLRPRSGAGGAGAPRSRRSARCDGGTVGVGPALQGGRDRFAVGRSELPGDH